MEVRTPASPTVRKSKQDLSVQCAKSGYRSVTEINPSGVEPWVFGNLLIGGIIGIVIDRSSGAQNHYSTAMSFTLPPSTPVPPVAAEPVAPKPPTT